MLPELSSNFLCVFAWISFGEYNFLTVEINFRWWRQSYPFCNQIHTLKKFLTTLQTYFLWVIKFSPLESTAGIYYNGLKVITNPFAEIIAVHDGNVRMISRGYSLVDEPNGCQFFNAVPELQCVFLFKNVSEY